MCAAEALAASNDRIVYCAYIDAGTGERYEARGTVDAQPERHLRGALCGLSVTWDPEFRTGEQGSRCLRGPAGTQHEAAPAAADADEWRWATPRADSELQRRGNEIAVRVLVVHHATLAERADGRAAVQMRIGHRRESAALRANRMWDPHAMHEVSLRMAMPRLHRMASRAIAQPPPPFAQLYTDVPTLAERQRIQTAVLEQAVEREREAAAAQRVAAAREAERVAAERDEAAERERAAAAAQRVAAAREAGAPVTRDRVEVYWPAERAWFPGLVREFDMSDAVRRRQSS